MNALHQTFYHFQAQLSEYLDRRQLDHYCSEIFSAYCCAATVQQTAQAITEIDRRVDL